MVPQLQVVEHVPEKYLPINLFDIHVRVYRCVKIWMVKFWQIFGQSSISPNFSDANVSLHMVTEMSLIDVIWLEDLPCLLFTLQPPSLRILVILAMPLKAI